MKFSYMAVTNEIKGIKVTGVRGNYEDTFKLISKYGYSGVEIMIKNPFEVDFNEIEKYARKYNLEIPVICTGEMYGEDKLSFGDHSAEIRKEAIRRTKETMRIAEYFNADVNVGRLRGRFVEGVHQSDTIKWAKEGLVESALGSKNARLLLEPINHKVSNFILNTEEGLQFIKDININNVRLMLDYIHMVIEKEDISQSVNHASGYFHHVHVCDSDRLPLGMGEYNFKDFAIQLKKVGYDGYISVEAFDTNDYENDVRGSFLIMEEAFGKQNQ